MFCKTLKLYTPVCLEVGVVGGGRKCCLNIETH